VAPRPQCDQRRISPKTVIHIYPDPPNALRLTPRVPSVQPSRAVTRRSFHPLKLCLDPRRPEWYEREIISRDERRATHHGTPHVLCSHERPLLGRRKKTSHPPNGRRNIGALKSFGIGSERRQTAGLDSIRTVRVKSKSPWYDGTRNDVPKRYGGVMPRGPEGLAVRPTIRLFFVFFFCVLVLVSDGLLWFLRVPRTVQKDGPQG